MPEEQRLHPAKELGLWVDCGWGAVRGTESSSRLRANVERTGSQRSLASRNSARITQEGSGAISDPEKDKRCVVFFSCLPFSRLCFGGEVASTLGWKREE